MAKRGTIFTRLDNIFKPDGKKTVSRVSNVNSYSIDNKEILRTKSKEEYDEAKLAAQQAMYLRNQWKRVDNETYQQAIHYETTRIGSYTDFENMEFYPEISAALDIMMEEASTLNEDGQILTVFSESDRVKRILEDLFFNRLDVHTNLPMWIRNTCKYGDNFIYLKMENNLGIVGATQLRNFEIERRENDLFNGHYVEDSSDDEDNDHQTRFYWKGRDLVFKSWQVAHFRLLGDDRKLPYGTSVLEKARRIWKQLLLSEDAMLIYRVTRAPERRVYKVFVGNIDDQDVEPYMNDIANRFKRTPLIDSQTGQIDLRYNQMAYDQDFFIPVRDENSPNPIDTLPGASNLDQIADIEYLQRKLFTSLRVPKSFLGFDEAQGEGKNLALQDIRFTRTINRIQQSILMELNKIAIIHLYLLGLEEELDNFKITMQNPSTQAEMLKIEHLQQKLTAYRDAVSDSGNGFGAMSMTKAKRKILGMSNDEIQQDLLEQRMEKAAAAELEKTESVIKYTGVFDKVDKIYGDMDVAMEGGSDGEGNEGDDSGSGGGGSFGGGGPIGDDDLDFGDDGAELEDENFEDIGDVEDVGDVEGEVGDVETISDPSNETIKKMQNILTENKKILTKKNKEKKKKYHNNYMNKLMNSYNKQEEKPVIIKMEDKTLKVNESINGMISDIDKILES